MGIWRAQPHPENGPDTQQDGTLRHAARVQQGDGGAGVDPILQGRKVVEVRLHNIHVFGRLIGALGCMHHLQTQMPGGWCHVIYPPARTVQGLFVCTVERHVCGCELTSFL